MYRCERRCIKGSLKSNIF